MNETFIVGGCSFTVGHELSDYDKNKLPSKKTWAYGLFKQLSEYSSVIFCTSLIAPDLLTILITCSSLSGSLFLKASFMVSRSSGCDSLKALIKGWA